MILSCSKKQKGFSLIELVTVLLIITVLSTIAIRSTVDIGYSARYEQTLDRLKGLRKAIVGNPKRSVNGQPDISGFVADMGRLPINLRELISSAAFCIDPDYGDDVSNDTLYGTQALCTGASYIWHTVAAQNTPQLVEGNLKSGWRGPYVQVNEAPTNTSADIFTDGWGNQANTIAPFEHYYDYGWYWCHWDSGDDGETLGQVGYQLPDDTDSTPDGFPNCNLTTSLNKLTIYSLGKNGLGDVEDNGSVTCGENEYDDDCYTTILQEDYLLNIDSGVSVSLQKPKTGFCGFTGSLLKAQASIASKSSCRNAGGQFSSSCVFTETACTTAGGLWNFSTSSCDIPTQAICIDLPTATPKGFGGIWDTESSSCFLDKTTCTARSGAWRGVTACQFDSTTCGLQGGTWEGGTSDGSNECTFDSATCLAASGTWDINTKNCEFAPDTSSDQCQDTMPAAIANTTWGCVIDRRSCGSVGGFWNYCEFDPDACSAISGSWDFACHFTESHCKKVKGNWSYDINTNQYECTFTSSAQCGDAGGSWDGASCSFLGLSCDNAGATPLGKCDLTQANCNTAGGLWDANTGQCGFADTSDCTANGGVSQGKECYLTHAEYYGSKYNISSCENESGEWHPVEKAICMNIFYRGADSTITYTSSGPVYIQEDGNKQSILFSGFYDSGDFDGDSDTAELINYIPIGTGSLGVYEYDGDCDPVNNPLYPSSRSIVVNLQILPNTTMSVIDW